MSKDKKKNNVSLFQPLTQGPESLEAAIAEALTANPSLSGEISGRGSPLGKGPTVHTSVRLPEPVHHALARHAAKERYGIDTVAKAVRFGALLAAGALSAAEKMERRGEGAPDEFVLLQVLEDSAREATVRRRILEALSTREKEILDVAAEDPEEAVCMLVGLQSQVRAMGDSHWKRKTVRRLAAVSKKLAESSKEKS